MAGGITTDSESNKIEGASDGTLIGNIGDRLKVTDDGGGSSGTPGAPCFSDKYRTLFDGASLTLTTSYQTRYTYSGSGKFVGFILAFSGSDLVVKLSIDSNVIFEINGGDLGDVQLGNPASSGPNSQPTAGGPSWDTTGKKMSFVPTFPIAYDTEVKIEIKRIGNNIDVNRSIVTLTKET